MLVAIASCVTTRNHGTPRFPAKAQASSPRARRAAAEATGRVWKATLKNGIGIPVNSRLIPGWASLSLPGTAAQKASHAPTN